MKLLQDELVRRNSDVQRQREEMESLRRKWEIEMEDILSSHQKEKQELDEFKKKYLLLKAVMKTGWDRNINFIQYIQSRPKSVSSRSLFARCHAFWLALYVHI